MKNNYTAFRDLSEFLDYVKPMPELAKQRLPADKACSWTTGLHGGFFGSPSFEAATKLMERGWDSGASRVMAMRASLESVVQTAQTAKASAMGWSTAGEWLHVGRAIVGRPDCFARVVDTGFDTCDRVVTVAMNASCVSVTSGDSVFMRGAVTLCLVDVLETLGHRVELVYGTCAERTHEDDVYDEFSVVVKKPGEHVDIDRLAFLYCHRDGSRRFCFRYYEHMGRKCSGYPRPMMRTTEDYPGCVIVPEIKYPHTPKSVIRDCLKAAGVTLDIDVNEE